jgi:hypothetical protein
MDETTDKTIEEVEDAKKED